VIEQAIYASRGAGGYQFVARSPGFRDDWQPEAERICTGFGERPAGASCPACVFAQPFGPRHVAVVQAAEQGADDAGRPGALGFRLLAVPARLYADLGGDPFLLADHFPPPWGERGNLPTLEWAADPPPPRTVEALQKVLDVPYSAVLLGGTQALLDGGRLVFERSEPAPRLVRGLWALLPTSSRTGLWPATYTFANGGRFHVAVVPRAGGPEFARYVDEVAAGDYPEGRYELALQTAVEAGDQAELDRLLARRSRAQMTRLALGILAAFVLVPLAVGQLGPAPPPPPAAAGPRAVPGLPAAEDCPRLAPEERDALAAALRDVGGRFEVPAPRSTSDADLADAVAALDARLGTPDRARDPGPLRELGPIQRQIRALLWKHGAADYQDRRLNTAELVERLGRKLGDSPAPAAR
jgi:hypothetical protein